MCLQNRRIHAERLKERMDLVEFEGQEFMVYKVLAHIYKNSQSTTHPPSLVSPLWEMPWIPGRHRAVKNFSYLKSRGQNMTPLYVESGIRTNGEVAYGIHVCLDSPNVDAYKFRFANHVVVKLSVRSADLIGADFIHNEACFTHATLSQYEWEKALGRTWGENDTETI
jgi:hypothetical protein